jgi:hypothetical protein
MVDRIKISEAEYRQHCEDYDGYCFKCADWTDGGVEPDARRYTCLECGMKTMYGAEELVLMDAVEFVG